MTTRWGIIGAGDMANKTTAPAMALDPDSELIAVMRRDPEQAKAFAERHGVPRYHTDAEALLRDEIDAVYIGTPVHLHAELTIAAAEHGKHVICEKPMAMSPTECDQMVEACRANGVQLAIAYYRRFYPKYERIQGLVREGRIGEVTLVRCQNTTWYCPAPDDPKAWRMDPEKGGGGVLMDIGSHRIDLLIGLLGMPREVTAWARCLDYPYPVDNAVLAIMQFDGSAQAVANFNWNTRGKADDLEVYGTEGRIVAGLLNEPELRLETGKGVETFTMLTRPDNVHLPMIQDFIRCLSTGDAPRVSGEEGAKTSQVMDAIYRSDREGRTVRNAECGMRNAE